MSNLIREILERIEYERLIEEGKDPKEVLHYKFKHVPSEIIDSVIEIDPTKKKSYSQWLLSHWNDEKNTIVNNLQNGRIEKLFQHYKSHNDIQIKDCPSVKEGLRLYVPEEETVLTKSSKPMTTLMNRGWTKEVPSKLANDFDIVFNEDNWIIAVPNTYEADCKLGENMNWCTAGGRSSFEGGRSYYDHYLANSGGKYFVNFDMSKGESRLGKDYPFTRYQFHFESNQFMDKEDDPVELDWIDMPESAKEFYESEGYSTDEYENLEARMERYDNQRNECEYMINNDLYLNISYDEDYEFTEPDADTDYYIFYVDDIRDPMCWDAVANPFGREDEVILLNTEDVVIIKRKYGDGGVIVLTKADYNYDWDYTTFDKYMIIGNNEGVFGFEKNKFKYISPQQNAEIELGIEHIDNMFVNEACTKADEGDWDRIFIEVVSNNYHSLFAVDTDVDYDLECLVKRDIPKNNEYYTINEQGLIEGGFRKYKAYDDEYYEEGQDFGIQYDLEEKLPNGDYVISIEERAEYGYGKKRVKYNILKSGSKEPLIDIWFDSFNGYTTNLYLFKKDNKFGVFSNKDGRQIGNWYDFINGIDKEKDIINGQIGNARFGSEESIEIISGYEGKVIGTFALLISTKACNNKIIVQDINKPDRYVYDYVEGRIYFPELTNFLRFNQYSYPYLFACDIKSTEEKAIFDLESLKVLVRGIKGFSKFKDYYIKLTKMDGKFNLFDMNKKCELLPTNVDDITDLNKYHNIVVYRINDKYYPFNYETKQVVINPNGIDVPITIYPSGTIYCEGNEYHLVFPYNEDTKNYEFNRWQNRNDYRENGKDFNQENTPQEVKELYYKVFGQQESITKGFKDYVNRIDEIMKLRFNDIVD